MKQKILLLFAIWLISRCEMNAQNLTYGWTAAATTAAYNGTLLSGSSTAIDPLGNVYTTGRFSGTVDFDPSVGGTTNLTSVGSSDIFIQKLDALGDLIWVKQIGNTNYDDAKGITLDAMGNIYTIGVFTGAVDFDPSSGDSTMLTSNGFTDIFIQKLNAAGNFVWAKSMGGGSYDYGYDVAVDAAGNVYTTGSFQFVADFDPGVSTANLTSSGLTDIYVCKLDALGNYVWAKSMGSTNGDNANGIALDASGNIYTAGYFSGTVDFDPGSGTDTLSSSGNYDMFIQKLNASGNYVWAKRMGSSNYDVANDITLDASGNVFTTGYFFGTVDFDPNSGTASLNSNGNNDIFIQKLDINGNYVWAKNMGGSSADFAHSIALDAIGNIYTTGGFQGTADFDPSSGSTANLTANGAFGYSDIYINILDASGNYLWAKRMGGSLGDEGLGIALDAIGNVYTTGFFQGTVNMNPLGGTETKVGNNYGIFTQKIMSCNTASIINASICSGSNYTFNGIAQTTTGFYTDTLINSTGCDSIIILNLTVGGGGSTINQSICSGTSYTFNGQSLITAGTYYDTLINVNGCDSIVTLHLTHYPQVGSTINQSICSGASYTFNGQSLSTAGTYYDTLINVNGCDSIITLNLTISTISASLTTNNPERCGENGSIEVSSILDYTILSSNNFSSAITTPYSTTNNATLNSGQLQLTSATNSQNGAVIYTPTSTPPNGLNVSFDMDIYSNQPAGNNIADGMSFNYGVIPNTLSGNYEDGIVSSNTGIVVRFKTWQTQRVEVVYNGVVKGTYNVDLHNPIIRKVQIAVTPTGLFSMRIGNHVLCTNLDLGTSYTTDNKSSWKMGWAARTGGSNNRHAIDNVEIINNNGIEFSIDNWASKTPLPFFNVATGSYTVQGGSQACASTLGTSNLNFNVNNFTSVANSANSNCNGRTISIGNTLSMDTLIWSDFASRPTLSNFNDLGNATFSNGNVQLTDNTGNQNGGIVFPQTPNAGVFTATFKARVWDGNNADGFSFNYGQIDNVWGAEGGMMNTNTPGLSVGFPTWNTNNIVVKYKNNVLTTVANTGSGGNRASFFTPVEVSVNAQYQLTVKWNGTTYINNYDLVANSTYETDAKTTWQFGWAARTGGQFDRHQLDDILVTGKTGLLYSYDGGSTYETNASKTISGTQAVNVVIKADGVCTPSTTNLAALAIPTFTPITAICSGSTLTLPTTSTNGIAGSWAPAVNNLATTTYTFTPSGGGCTTTMTVQVNPLPTITSVSATPSIICAGDSSTLQVIVPSTATIVSTFAGSGTQGSTDGNGTVASFNYPYGVTTDAAGNVYVADLINHKIRKITPSGNVTTFAGSGSIGNANGNGIAASFNQPNGVATDAAGNVFVADRYNHKIRKITPAGDVTTFAGSGSIGSDNGNGIAASFYNPAGVATDAAGNVYVADQGNHKIRKITPAGDVTTLAGSGSQGSANSNGIAASFNVPSGVATDAVGNVYVADYYNNRIRKITPSGDVTTFAGSGSMGSTNGNGSAASFYRPYGVATDAVGNVYVADHLNNKIRKITPSGDVTTLAGNGSMGSVDGNGTAASFNGAIGVATDAAGNVYVADVDNHKIRKITQPVPQTYTWSGTVNGLSVALDTVSVMPTATTLYTVTASTAAGCTTTSTVTAIVKPNYTITANAGANGSMSPTGNAAVCEGSNVNYTITPNANYQIADVLVDGISVGAVSSYTFSNVTTAHTINASFVLICAPSSNTTNATSCYSYTWSVNNATYSISGIYTNISGCHIDSLVLTIEACKEVKCFLSGYYAGAGVMQPVLMNQGISAPATACDTIDVSLHSTVSPYNEVYSFKGVLSTAGLISCIYPEAAIGNSYYLVVKHRNSLEIWSADPILISNNNVYDFSTASNKAFASNQMEVEPGVFAMYTGDLNHDGFVDSFDFPVLDADIFNGVGGVYANSDLNGDGFADSFDFPILDLNSFLGASVMTP